MTTSVIGTAVIGTLCTAGMLRFGIYNRNKPALFVGVGFFIATIILTLTQIA